MPFSEQKIIRCATTSPTLQISGKEDQRVTEGTYFDWCKEEGCETGGSSPYILRQKVSPSKRRQTIEDVDGCADLRLTESNILKFTRIQCKDRRKPLCMRGDPIINKRKKKRRNRIQQRKVDIRKKLKRVTSQWRKLVRNKKRKGRQLLRQEPSPPVEMCATAGK